MIYLPPANEVWGKVIFSQACVKNPWSGGGAWSWGGAWSGGMFGDPPGTATAAGGTHPTGMHSCSLSNLFSNLSITKIPNVLSFMGKLECNLWRTVTVSAQH